MRPSYLIFGLSLIFGNSAAAQTTTVPVRGGEHEDFTRLVIPMPEANTWRVTTNTQEARLVVGGPPVVFDLTQTFARIPRTRLQSVVADAEGLVLQLGCACDVRAAEDIPEYLVIDIVGTSVAPVPDRPSVLRPRQRPAAETQQAIVAPTTSVRAGAKLALLLKQGEHTHSDNHSMLIAQMFDTNTPSHTHLQGQTDSSADMRTQIERELGQALARSVGEGLLKAADQPPSPPPSRSASVNHAQIPASLVAHLSVTGGGLDWSPEATVHADKAGCLGTGLLDVSTWPLDQQDAGAGGLLGELFTDTNAIRESRAVDLAKRFLADGFGVEGRMVLSLLDPEDAQIALLRAMSYLIDLASLPSENPFLPHSSCADGASLWVFLSLPDSSLPEDFRFSDLVQRVTSLPQPLRLHLGPVIIDRLVGLGRQEEAEQIRSALDRVAQAKTPSLQLARTQLDLLAAAPEHVSEIETRLSPDMSDEALLFLLTRRDTEDATTDPHLLDLAQSRLLALRASPTGQELARLTVRALARNLAFAEAFDLLEGRQSALPSETIARMRVELLDRLTRDSSDSDFVLLVFQQAPWDVETLPWQTRHALAQRLEALGFDRQAIRLRHARSAEPSALQRPAEEEQDSPEETGPEMAPSALAPDDPDLLRARDAVSSLREATDSTDPSESAATPDVAIPAPDTIRSQASRVETERPAENEREAVGLLAQGRAVLEDSSALRNRLEALLAENSVSP